MYEKIQDLSLIVICSPEPVPFFTNDDDDFIEVLDIVRSRA
tara:strand:- start:1011 stop:1133 length:123 start_codon:yes stop_codon:yes gene_type:complete